MTQAQLREAHAAGKWQPLWLQAIPLVKRVISQLIARGTITTDQATDDLLQEGLLSAGRAIRTWKPGKGPFPHWVCRTAHGAMLDHIRRAASGMVGGMRASGKTLPLFEEILEGGTREPYEMVLQEQQAIAIRSAISRLKIPEDRELISRVYGIDCEAETLPAIATQWGRSLRSVQRMFSTACRKLAGLL